ncbi:MAG TPA: AtpZ/AtpI family protein [Gammaproteobacteria bacterium]|nr:AtpZ/AtpI family protein [Gammaproteobacteria bacterium]
MRRDDELQRKVTQQARRMRKAERDRPTLLAQTRFIGSLGLLFVLPVILGAYLGLWLDERMPGYSVAWTVALITLGVVIGAVNVYLYVREKD